MKQITIKNKIIIIARDGSFSAIRKNIKLFGNFKTGEIGGAKNAEIIFSSIEDAKNIDMFCAGAVLVFNNDDAEISAFSKNAGCSKMNFGLTLDADVAVSDINESEEITNFKLNYKGSSIPVWMKNISGKNELYDVLPAVCVGALSGLNSLEISEILKNRH